MKANEIMGNGKKTEIDEEGIKVRGKVSTMGRQRRRGVRIKWELTGVTINE
jgi:hypothetical protein